MNPANIDHIYYVLPKQEYQELIQYHPLRALFANVVTKTVETGTGDYWAGTYFQSLHSYLEILVAEGEYAPCQTGLAFSFENIGTHPEKTAFVQTLLSKGFAFGERSLKTDSGVTMPWFDFVSKGNHLKTVHSLFHIWNMFYQELYLKLNGVEVDPERFCFKREQFRRAFLEKSGVADRVAPELKKIRLCVPHESYDELHEAIADLSCLKLNVNRKFNSKNGVEIEVFPSNHSDCVLASLEFEIKCPSDDLIRFEKKFGRLNFCFDGKKLTIDFQ